MLVAVPPGVVTVILPVIAPTGTVTCKEVVLDIVTEVDVMPLNCTVLPAVKFVPVSHTNSPTVPSIGENRVSVGGR